MQATIEGVTAPLAIQAASINELRKAVRLLQANQLLAAQAPAPIVWSYTPEGFPICPKHGTPMKRREKQGDHWHSHNVGIEDRPLSCRGYAGKRALGSSMNAIPEEKTSARVPAPPTTSVLGSD